METEIVKISKVKNNPNNPRLIKDDKFKKLVRSIKEFPEMMKIRPIVVNDDMVVLGGNMRLRACKDAGLKEIPIIKASELTEKKQREFIIKDNVGFGEWDWDDLANEWDADQLEDWGLDLPVLTETEKLSELKFEDIYYEPKDKPDITLDDCINMNLFNKKCEFIDQSNLSDDKKNLLKMFACRFLKIDFENVANYYYFNADEEEQKVMERLRLVLCDAGLNGFIQDDIIRMHQIVEGWSYD
jgi:hypothetical protein